MNRMSRMNRPNRRELLRSIPALGIGSVSASLHAASAAAPASAVGMRIARCEGSRFRCRCTSGCARGCWMRSSSRAHSGGSWAITGPLGRYRVRHRRVKYSRIRCNPAPAICLRAASFATQHPRSPDRKGGGLAAKSSSVAANRTPHERSRRGGGDGPDGSEPESSHQPAQTRRQNTQLCEKPPARRPSDPGWGSPRAASHL
jgi:hypothetical protein